MKLKNIDNGTVKFIMRVGKDFVKSSMPIKNAEKIIEEGKISKSNKHKGFNICVDDKYFFATESETKKSAKKTECE